MKRILSLAACVWVLSFALRSAALPPPEPGMTVNPERWATIRSRIPNDHSDANLAGTIRQIKAIKAAMEANPDLNLVAPSLGNVRVPLLLGEYSDSTGQFSAVQMDNQIFETNPSGTMVTYYQEISYNNLQLTGDTLGYYTAPESQAYYACETAPGGDCDAGFGPGFRGREFIADIVALADADIGMDWSLYDANNDCIVDVVMVAHTDGGAETQDNDNLWSHRSSLAWPGYTTSDPCPLGGNMIVRDYILQPEESGDGTSNTIVDIGVYCHEFGHALGLPDLYDTDNSSEGIGGWGLMASGSYGGGGGQSETPSHMCAWSKEQMGWLTPTDVTVNLYGENIASSSTSATVYRMRKNGAVSGDEYFLVENRTQTGFDSSLIEPGLLIWHIDDAQPGNQDENHYLVDLEQADGLRDMNLNIDRGDSGDPYPGSTTNRSFSPLTNPNSGYYSEPSYIEVNNVSDAAATMVADLIVVPGISSGLRLADAEMDGDVDMADAQNALRTLLGLESGTGCAYPTMLVSGDNSAGVEDVMLIGQYANSVPSLSLPGPAGGPVTLAIDFGDNQDGVGGVTLADPLRLYMASKDPSVCAKTIDANVQFQVVADTTGGAYLYNPLVPPAGTLVSGPITANDGLTDDIDLTLGTALGQAEVDGWLDIFNADASYLSTTTASFQPFNQTCGNGAMDNPDEECDDGNLVDEDGCSSSCLDEYCGDGVTQAGLGEECDDGGNLNGDGCDEFCIVEGNADPSGDNYTGLPVNYTFSPDLTLNGFSISGGNLAGSITLDVAPGDDTVYMIEIELDTDQNSGTGCASASDSHGWVPLNSTNHQIGYEYSVIIRDFFGSGNLDVGAFPCSPSGTICGSVSRTGDTLDFTCSLSDLGGDDGNMNVVIVGYARDGGSVAGVDVAPNGTYYTVTP